LCSALSGCPRIVWLRCGFDFIMPVGVHSISAISTFVTPQIIWLSPCATSSPPTFVGGRVPIFLPVLGRYHNTPGIPVWSPQGITLSEVIPWLKTGLPVLTCVRTGCENQIFKNKIWEPGKVSPFSQVLVSGFNYLQNLGLGFKLPHCNSYFLQNLKNCIKGLSFKCLILLFFVLVLLCL